MIQVRTGSRGDSIGGTSGGVFALVWSFCKNSADAACDW